MKVTYKELLERLSVNYDMQGYQTQPWQHVDTATGVTYSAEVRVMDGDRTEIEAEISTATYKDNADEPKIDVLMWLQARPSNKDKYAIVRCLFEGENFISKTAGWEDKICRFFRGFVGELKLGKTPDFEAIKKKAMESKDGKTGGAGGGTSGRNPKVQGSTLLHDMKKGGMGI